MTKTSLTADRFWKYFRYKLANGKFLLLLSSVMGVLSFVQCSVFVLISAIDAKNSGAEQEFYARAINYENWKISRIFAYLSGAAMIGIVVYAAISSLNFYQQRHETDMLGSLPINHKTRFFGDVLSGYALGVLPYSLLSALSVPMIAAAESHLATTLYTQVYAYSILTVFFALSLLYALGVLAVSICGKVISSIVCTLILVAASLSSLSGAAEYIMYSIAGMPSSEISAKIRELTPSLLLLYESVDSVVTEMPLLSEPFHVIDNESLREIIDNTAAAHFPNVLVWAAETAILILAAFFLTKFRKAERTGSAFGHKYGFYVFLLGTVVMMFNLVNAAFGVYSAPIEGITVTAIVSAVIFLVFEISMRRGWKKFGMGAAVLVGSLALTFGIAWSVKYTGVFGLRNWLPSADKVVMAKFDDYEFTDREDIEQLIQNHHDFLSKYGNDVGTYEYREGDGAHFIEYYLEDGSVFTRGYYPIMYYGNIQVVSGGESECKTALDNLPIKLKDYKEQVLKSFDSKELLNCTVFLKGAFGGVIVKPEKLREFEEVLIGDHAENTLNGKKVGMVDFYTADRRLITIDIYDSFEKTVEFLTDTENTATRENDEETVCYSMEFSSEKLTYFIEIRKKDMENEKVKELLSLIEQTDKTSYNRNEIFVHCRDYVTAVYVPTENKQRFNRLLLEYFEESMSS